MLGPETNGARGLTCFGLHARAPEARQDKKNAPN